MTDIDQSSNVEGEMQIELKNTKLIDNDGSGMGFASYFSSAGMYESATKMKPTEWITKNKESLRPWTEFVKFSKFSKPIGLVQCMSRLKGNIGHFHSNYLVMLVILAVYCIITSPYLLFAFTGTILLLYFVQLQNKNGTVKILGKEFSTAQVYAGAGFLSIPLFLLAGGGSAVFWILGMSFFVIVLHGVFYSREEMEDSFIQMNIV